jgi:ribosomal subunit interface protein
MKTNTKVTNISSSPAISQYLDKRLSKIEKLIGNDSTVICSVELAKTTSHHNKGDIFKAEIHIVGAGKDVYATSDKTDLYSAIDDVCDEIKNQLKSTKEKNISLMRRSGARVKNMVKGLWPWKGNK